MEVLPFIAIENLLAGHAGLPVALIEAKIFAHLRAYANEALVDAGKTEFFLNAGGESRHCAIRVEVANELCDGRLSASGDTLYEEQHLPIVVSDGEKTCISWPRAKTACLSLNAAPS